MAVWLARMSFPLARLLLRYQQGPLALRMMHWCAERGHARAASEYGHWLWFRGQGRQARAEGARFLRLAAESGEAKAQYQWGKLLEEGDQDLFCDPVQACDWYVKAAEQGHALAIRRIAKAYQHGELGLGQDSFQASRWLNRLPPVF
ncbi:tetratricopeptide repeat protein [Balneatrix alpica]|uniref:Tetratricopeptide repeat protein n=1 Tax=Balneatrix alpica TaxID=75684 RepID=A0ABV5ZEH5_9GAMM|nr:SEL1-like repeat protein [Balneatrix alpica]